MMNLPNDFGFDVTARYVDALSAPQVPSYLVFDVRFAWQIEDMELSVVGRNLGDNQHPEFRSADQVPHSVYAKVSWRY